MSKPLVSDALWAAVEPLLPPEPPKPMGGRPRLPDRAALTGILFVLQIGIPWQMLPQEMGSRFSDARRDLFALLLAGRLRDELARGVPRRFERFEDDLKT